MKKFARSICLLAVSVLLLSHAGTARAQEAAQPKTPLTPKQALLENWNSVGSRLITMAQDWPEDKYTYKLNPAVRTFQQVLLHVAGRITTCSITSPEPRSAKRRMIHP